MDVLAFLLGAVALLMAFRAGRRANALQVRLDTLLSEVRAFQTAMALGRRPDGTQARATEAQPDAPVATRDAAPDAVPDGVPHGAPDEPAAAPEGPPSAVPDAPQAVTMPTLEERLGTRWAVWVGGLALALGGILLVRYSIEQGVFGPGVRVVLGLLFALLLIAAGEWFRRSERVSPVEAIPAAPVRGILTAGGTMRGVG